MIPNMWYAVLESNEVKSGKPYSFKRLNEDLVFWRDKAGSIAGMRDRCPHRSAKLSPGKIVDGNIQCPFHGFQYNQERECQFIPANGRGGPRPKIFQCRTYPAQEAHGLIWVWYGDVQTEYPRLPFFDDLQGFAYSTFHKEWEVHYPARLKGSAVTVNCVHPGVFRSNLGSNNNDPPEPLWMHMITTIGRPFLRSAEQAAERVIHLAVSSEVEGVSGKYFGDKRELQSPPQTHDPAANRRLWTISAVLTGLPAQEDEVS